MCGAAITQPMRTAVRKMEGVADMRKAYLKKSALVLILSVVALFYAAELVADIAPAASWRVVLLSSPMMRRRMFGISGIKTGRLRMAISRP